MNKQQIIEYVIMAIVAISGWMFAIGRKVLASYIMEQAGKRFVSKEIYDKDAQQVKESLRVIEIKIDRLMEA